MTIAQRFIAGRDVGDFSSPVGTTDRSFKCPDGTRQVVPPVPSDKSLGYYQTSLTGRLLQEVYSSLIIHHYLFNPIGNKDIGIAALFGVAIGGEDEFFAVGREHGEAVEGRVEGDLL